MAASFARNEGTGVGAWPRITRLLRRVPRQDRARSLVRAILDAAVDNLDAADSGPLQVLFERAGVAAGSFYEYFGSRESLLRAVVEHVSDHNFDAFLEAIDRVTEGDESLESAMRHSADVIVRHYLQKPAQLRTLIRISDRLGLLTHIARERDRFADSLCARMARLTPHMTEESRSAMMRAIADAVTGLVVVAVHRAPTPDIDEVCRAAGDVCWGLARVHARL